MKYKSEKEFTKIKLGKIDSVKFGLVGYEDSMLGLGLVFSIEGGRYFCNDAVHGLWSYDLKRSESAKWSEQDRDTSMVEMLKAFNDVLTDAKVKDVTELSNKPVECKFDDNDYLVSWRILTEVL